MDGTIWLWIGMWGMAAGFLALAFLSKARTEEAANEGVIHTVVPAIAAVFYLLMGLGAGEAVLSWDNGRLFYWARYVDWSFTTPLLLLGLCFTALGSLKGNIALISALVFSDVAMILTGLFAGIAPSGSASKWIWYLVSCGFFLAVLYVIWGPLLDLAKARTVQHAKIYQRNAAILSVLWILYPVVFFFGSEGVNTLAPALVLAAFTILDLTSKVAYGLLAVTQHKTADA